MPKAKPQEPLAEEDVFENAVKHGEEYVDPDELDDDEGDGDEGEEDNTSTPEPKAKTPEPDPLDEIKRTLAGLASQVAAMNQPKVTPGPKEPEEKIDWEDLMFKDPAKYHELLTQSITNNIESKLTNKYQQAEGEKDFWNGFYKDNDDLKDDRFLVDAVLKANMNELAPMTVKEAGKRLAELTRAEIMRYTGNKLPSNKKKAVTEGSQPPSPGKKEPEKEKVTTLSDLIKARRAKRMNSKGTAA
jgi:hypothetical protein